MYQSCQHPWFFPGGVLQARISHALFLRIGTGKVSGWQGLRHGFKARSDIL
jgi:hypothetical protein